MVGTAFSGSNGSSGWGGPGPSSPAPLPAAAAEVQVRPGALGLARPAPKPPARPRGRRWKARRAEVIRARGHSVTRCATTWEKSFQLRPWGLSVSPSGAEARPLAPAPFSVACSRVPLPGKPPPSCALSEIPPSLAAQVTQDKYSGSLSNRLLRRLRQAWCRGSRDKCPEEAAGGAELGARSS